MKFFMISIVFLRLHSAVVAEVVLPPDIANGISKSGIGESGGLFVHGVERERFINFICKDWRNLLNNIEDLPKGTGNFISDQSAIDSSVINVGAACESLGPIEYLDFMDKFLDLCEQDRIKYRPLEFQLSTSEGKDCFLEVNWEHPRVQNIFTRARRLIPSAETATLSWLDEAAKGELADNYMTNKSDNARRPETLPGIKLKRPWDSLIKKYEQLTGKKVSYDAKFAPRPSRRTGLSDAPTTTVTHNYFGALSVWIWIAVSIILLFVAFFLWKLRRGSKTLPSSRL